MQTLKRRGHPENPPPLSSDGWGGHREALVEVWGKVPARREKTKPPTRKQPQAGWQYLQVVPIRRNKTVIGIVPRVRYGKREEVLRILGCHTAYVERTNLTSRQMNARLARKTLGFSKSREMLEASCAWEDAAYNLMRPLKTLRVPCDGPRRRWQHRSPAMAAGLTDHLWTPYEVLTALPIPSVNNF